ncbi:hypothetical protein HanIR_Chr17g0877501 [Helianthus annuus]|nr:hypothetical protein HanIR_Chr17g0877501 [Helianthus annuus]
MSRTGRSSIRSVLTVKDLEIFVDTYHISERFSSTLPGPDDPAECSSERIVISTLSFSSCGVCYPFSAFKVDLLENFGIHFSKPHPLAFMRVVHFELSCVAVAGEPSVPLFCMFYKLVSDGDWFTFAKRKDSVSPLCYSFMPTSTYPKEWKNRFIFASAEMMPGSPPPLRDPKAPIEDIVPVLSADEIVQWKRIHLWFWSYAEMTLWGLLQGDYRDIKFMVRDKVDPDMSRALERKAPGMGSSVHVEDSVAAERDEKASSEDAGDSWGSLWGSSKAPIVIPPVLASSRVMDKTPEVSVARVDPAFDISPLQDTGTSKPSHPEGLPSRSPLAPLFAEGLPVPYVPKWKITTSSVVGNPETARDFLDHVVPPPHKFMNFALNPNVFDDQYSMSLCEGFFRGGGDWYVAVGG